ncbi:PepSY domain-containing protein [Lederbergia lenta]|uniref:Proteptide PepSY amd peptidase M4 n=1 Tax=Lederbergia lenta TaxID=1467 RepID=A0A2X4YRI2_LEDLE|nr:PepSY domain-containing protein [Lederbergia lenta]MCM3111048.1 PepSY domain-containing protein [Lederbergia lenta]MEC2325564.1 PepSY domain-containing protein [Lederbergia lenta]SQI54235.1 proteptide PepSY amd peptidase M4 [Lederbergia lenta]
MNWKTFLTGACAGLIGGYLLRTKVNDKMPISGEKVLANVKQAFKKEGRIDGSWLQMKPEDYQKYAIKTKIYRGGITTNTNGTRQQFEFIADAYTGTVLNVYPI